MDKTTADGIATSVETGGFGYTRTVDTAGNHQIGLAVSSLTGSQMLWLVGILAPNGVPLVGVRARLDIGKGITIA
jgi:hypothetical protein